MAKALPPSIVPELQAEGAWGALHMVAVFALVMPYGSSCEACNQLQALAEEVVNFPGLRRDLNLDWLTDILMEDAHATLVLWALKRDWTGRSLEERAMNLFRRRMQAWVDRQWPVPRCTCKEVPPVLH
jgi:hypothetical protein